jgi:MoaA/NifB/PqqE/SkfB family radical SAM enzyme
MCSRNYHGGIDNPLITESEWSITDFKKIFTPTIKKQINKITFCGNFGDPLLNNDLTQMLDYIKDDDIYVDIHTNGSLRNSNFWKELPRHLPPYHKVVFALDGLADTHSKYRIGTDFYKILQNAKTFIHSGGTAEWSMIRFKHNAHQVDAARELANTHNFDFFTVKDSSRFALDNKFNILNNQGSVVDILEPNTLEQEIDVKQIPAMVEQSVIDCWAKKQNEVYIDAHLDLMPCCFLASIPYNYFTSSDKFSSAKNIISEQYKQLITELGDTNLQNNSIEYIISKSSYQTVWTKYWTTQKLYTCARTCGNLVKTPSQQFAET